VAYNPDTKAFYSAADEPPAAACRVHECSECRHPQADKLSDNEAPCRFSPVHVPTDIEKAYLVTLADWWKKEQGTVHVMDTRPPKERRVSDVDTGSIQRSRYNRVFVDVIVEVSNFTNSEANCACMTQISSIGHCYTQKRTPAVHEVYVTDYTVHHELYGAKHLAQILCEKLVDGLDFALDVARGHRLIPVSFFDTHADMAEKMRVGQFYRLRNLGISRNRWGNLEGSVKVYKCFEAKDVQLVASGSGHNDEFKAFLECVLLH